MAFDLDKARAARREKLGEGPKVVIGGEEYELAVEMPYDVLEAMRGMANELTAPTAIVDTVKALLGEEGHKAFLALKPPPTVDDCMELVDALMGEYGVDAPLTSSASSESTTTR